MITSRIFKTQTDYFQSPCILCGQDHTAITEDIDTINKTITITISISLSCPIIIRTDPSTLASHYGYQPDDIREAWSRLSHTRYARTNLPQLCLCRLIGKALKICELVRAKWNFKRSSQHEEEYTIT